jgi:hypothetical protein
MERLRFQFLRTSLNSSMEQYRCILNQTLFLVFP